MGFSVQHLLVVLVIVVLVFGTKKLRTLGGDLGGAIKSFRSAINEAEEEKMTGDKVKSSDENPAVKNHEIL